MQFLMALHNDFEGLRDSILYHSPLPYVDSIVSGLLAEEIRLKPHYEKGILFASNPSILDVPSNLSPNNTHRLPLTSALFVRKKVIGSLNVLS